MTFVPCPTCASDIELLHYGAGLFAGDCPRCGGTFERTAAASSVMHSDVFSPLLSAADLQSAAPGDSALRAEVVRLGKVAAERQREADTLRLQVEEARARPVVKGRPVRRERESARAHATVLAALEVAASRHAEVLTVYDDARRAARRCDSRRTDAVFRALDALADIGREYFHHRDGGRSMGSVEDAVRRRLPFKYTAHESVTTMSKYGDARVFRHGDRYRRMERHMTIAAGDFKNCVQIYFEFDDESKRVEVGHCGRHLPCERKPT